MWRWTSFIHFLVLYQYSIPQPISNESENVRQSRQLDVGECCPCPGSSQIGFDHESDTSFGQGIFDGGHGVEECPCRRLLGDAEGASSMSFPNAMRAASTFLKPTEKKEDVKPLLHPEVDLASSVLETLREATNEEYREALARDAVRDAVKIAGLSDAIFKDATPEESRSIVSIIMNPKEDHDDDIVPQSSHLQESRCIHAPLGTARSNLLGKLKIAPKLPLINEIRLRQATHPGLLHKNFMDMDSNVGASNVQEHVVNVDEELMNNRDAGPKPRVSLFKFNQKRPSLISIERNSDLKSPSISNVLKDPLNIGSSLFHTVKDNKIGQLPVVPRTRLEGSSFENSKTGNNDLSVLPSNGQENVYESKNTLKKEIPILRKPTQKQNIFENTRHLNLKNLLKLEDVELLPLDIFNKRTAVTQPTILSSKPSRKNNDVITKQTDKNQNGFLSNLENNELSSKETPNEDCFTKSKEHETKNIQTVISKPFNSEPEIFDTIPNPSNTICSVDNGQESSEDSENHEIPITDELSGCVDDCETDEEHKSKTTSDCENSEPRNEVNGEDFKTDKNHYLRSTSDNENSGHDASNNRCDTAEENANMNDNESTSGRLIHIEDNFEPEERQEIMAEQNIIPQESSSLKNTENIHSDIVETTTTKYKLHQPLPLDKTLLSIREKIKNTLENINNINTDSKDLSKQNKSTARVPYDDDNTQLYHLTMKTDLDFAGEKSEQLDCVSENSEQLTTFKPTLFEDNIEKNNKDCNSVTIEELQKMSDTMLQEEIISNVKNVTREEKECAIKDRSTENMLENKGNECVNHDSETSANTQTADVILPILQADDTISRGSSNDMAKFCHSDISRVVPTQKLDLKIADSDKPDSTEMDSDASNLVINKLSREIMPLENNFEYPPTVDKNQQISLLNNNPLSVFETPLPDVRNILKLDTLPSFDDIKLKFSNTFNTNEREAQDNCPSISKPFMAADASTANFQIKQPLRLMSRENLNLDIFPLKPISNLKSPIVDLDLHKTNLFSNDLSLKPIKLQSLFGNTDDTDVLGLKSLLPNDIYATPKVSDVVDDIIENLPSFDDLRDKIRSNTQELLNKPSFLENLNGKLDLSDLKYNAENSFKNLQDKLTAVENNFRSPMKTSNYLLDTIAEKHEDLSDKLRAVHIDVNDRLESMRNSLINPTYLNNDRKNNNIKSLNNSNSKDRHLLLNSRTPAQVSNRKESLLRTETQRKVKPITSQAIIPRKYKMPAAASMPVPKTVEIPKLKATTIKSDTPTIKDAPIFKSSIRSTEPPPLRTSTIMVKEAIKNLQNTNRQLGVKQVNPFKNSKVIVSFSTTPRPSLSQTFKPRLASTAIPNSRLKSTARENAIADSSINNSKSRSLKNIKDSNGALSETKAAILPPDSNIDDKSHIDENDNLEDTRKPNLLQTWPKPTESSFLAKVKEAVTARLPKANIANKLAGEVGKSSLRNKLEDRPFVNGAQAASENSDIIREEPLEDNVSYKCTMVCTRE